MPKTLVVSAYISKANSETLALVVPKQVREELKMKAGDQFLASADTKGRGTVKFRRLNPSNR
jgi:hypothetical protein